MVQALPAFLQCCSIFFMPESPRFLYSRGRVSEARQILLRYHANNAPSDPLVDFQMSQISHAIAIESSSKTTSWSHVLRSRPNRKRFGICIAVALLTLWNGQGVISYYFSPILTSIGITSTPSQTGINGGLQIWNLLCSLLGTYLSDRLGRRTLWLTSFIGMMAANIPLTITSARYAHSHSPASAYATVVFLFLYNAAFNLACNPLLYAYTTELLPFAIRTKGLAVQVAVSEAALTVNQYVNPIALEKIGFWYFVFYLGMLVIGTAVIWFAFPETKGRTLEQLGEIFEERPSVIGGIEVGEEFGENLVSTDAEKTKAANSKITEM